MCSFQLSIDDTFLMFDFGKEVLIAQGEDLDCWGGQIVKIEVGKLAGYEGRTPVNLFSKSKNRIPLTQDKFNRFCSGFENCKGITPERKKAFQEWKEKIDKIYVDLGKQSEAALVIKEEQDVFQKGDDISPSVPEMCLAKTFPVIPPDPAFYVKKKHRESLKQKEGFVKRNIEFNFAALICAVYCVYFIVHAKPYGNWWWFGGAALFFVLALVEDIISNVSDSSQKNIIEQRIEWWEHYRETGNPPDWDLPCEWWNTSRKTPPA